MAATVSSKAGAYISISRIYSKISNCFILNDFVPGILSLNYKFQKKLLGSWKTEGEIKCVIGHLGF
jgi:hypothetical protein